MELALYHHSVNSKEPRFRTQAVSNILPSSEGLHFLEIAFGLSLLGLIAMHPSWLFDTVLSLLFRCIVSIDLEVLVL